MLMGMVLVGGFESICMTGLKTIYIHIYIYTYIYIYIYIYIRLSNVFTP